MRQGRAAADGADRSVGTGSGRCETRKQVAAMGKDKKKTAAAEAAATAALASSRAAVDAMRAAHAARIAVEDLKKEQRRTLRIELRKKARFLLSVLVILVYYGAGYLYYSDAEGWDLVDSVYFAVVTVGRRRRWLAAPLVAARALTTALRIAPVYHDWLRRFGPHL